MTHYTIYQITNLVNNMIYVGQHRTEDLDDSYMGSGILIQNAIKKFGKQNFKKQILFDFQTFEEMNAKEAEIVNEEFVQRADTYNLTVGGNADKGYALRDRKILNNGIQQKHIKIVDVPKYIANGWELGLLDSKKQQISDAQIDRVWIRNIELNENLRVKKDQVQIYLSIPGWELGQLPRKHPKLPILSEKFQNYRIICRDGIEKHVPYWEVDAYLLDGWQLGSKKSLAKTLWHNVMKNAKWMHKDNLFEQKVLNEDIETYLADGWTFGRLFHAHNIHQKCPEHVKAYFKLLWIGSKFMNDGTITRQILKKDIELFLALGWKFGGLNNQNRIHVNNGQITHFVKREDLDKYLENGFKLGRLPFNNKAYEYKNFKWIHNIETHKNKKLKASDPMPAGYIEGIYISDETAIKLSNRTKGNRYIMNDITGEVTHIKQGDQLPNGWHYGRRKRKLTDAQKENIHKKAIERTWYTNGKENKMIPWGKEQPYIDAGWYKGRSNFHVKRSKTLWYTNGSCNKMISPDEEQQYIDMGWKRGKLHTGKLRRSYNLIWYTNGKENKMIPLGKEQPYIDAGWYKGMTRSKVE